MPKEIIEYIASERVGVISVEMLNGSPHAATVHFAHNDEPLRFIFETERTYRKSEPLLKNAKTRAALVIGFEEGPKAKTLQLNGEVQVTKDIKHRDTYLKKFSEKADKAENPDVLFFTFTPTWWRFTDWGRPEGKTIITSDEKLYIRK